MNGKGDKRRPESKSGNFNKGYDEIDWRGTSKTKDTLKKPNKKKSNAP